MVDLSTMPTGTDLLLVTKIKQQADEEIKWVRDDCNRRTAELRGDLLKAEMSRAALQNEVDTLKGTDAEAVRYAERVRARWFRRELARENRIRHHLIVAACVTGGLIFGVPAVATISALLWRLLWRVML